MCQPLFAGQDRRSQIVTENMDTICAVSTPPGIGGIAIVRMSGERTYAIIRRLFRAPRPYNMRSWPSHTVRYGHVLDGSRVVDEVLVTILRAPRSYTREDMAEIGCHGGYAASREVLELCLRRGARLAEPGEFTRRALLNGRIDLSQAESVLEVIESRTGKALELSLKKLDGGLSRETSALRKSVLGLLCLLEARMDFPEENINGRLPLKTRLTSLRARTEKLLCRARRGRVFFDGVRVAIVGRTNVGKSSLLNAFLREERAIVTPVPGTTRDALQETISIRGIPLKIIDTAGIRRPRGRVERMGVRKALEWMERAEINILVVDGSCGPRPADRKLIAHLSGKEYVVAVNKSDLRTDPQWSALNGQLPADRIVHLSAKTCSGLERLEEVLYRLIVEGHGAPDGTEFYLNARQGDILRRVRDTLARACRTSSSGSGMELVAEDLRTALKELDNLAGRDFNREVLDAIFRRFCIGK